MTRLMSRLTNTLAAAAVAATALATPAPVQAGDKDVLKGLAAIAAIALVAGALQQQQGGGGVTRNQPLALLNGFQGLQGGTGAATGWQNGGGNGNGNGWQNGTSGRQTGWQDRRQQNLPAVCAIDIDGRYPTTIYADACLRREGFAQSLPQDCAQQIRSRDWQGRVYDGECLRDAGFRAERRY